MRYGGACGTDGGKKRCIEGFGAKTQYKYVTWKNKEYMKG